MPKFVCCRQIECLLEVEADSIQEALACLPDDPDGVLESADGVAFGSAWSIQLNDHNGQPGLYDDSDVEEAKELHGDLLGGL